MRWLRRRIIASIAAQTAETFAAVAVAAFALMQWRTAEGPVGSLMAAIVIGQLVALARLGHAVHNNPLSYSFLRQYVDQSFRYSVARFVIDEEPHPVARRLPRFEPVATIRGTDPSPVFDVFHDPSRLVALSIERASGSLTFVSALLDGRILVTDSRAIPPHERLVMNLTPDSSVRSLITAHQRAISGRTDVIEFTTSAHQLVLDSLAIEHQAYVALGPVLGPFLDIEPRAVSPLRLSTRVKPAELAALPTLFGQDLPLNLRRPDVGPEPSLVTQAPVALPIPVVAAPMSAPAPVVDPHIVAMTFPDIVPAIPVPEVRVHGTDEAFTSPASMPHTMPHTMPQTMPHTMPQTMPHTMPQTVPGVPWEAGLSEPLRPTYDDEPHELVGVGSPQMAMTFSQADDSPRTAPRLSAMLRANTLASPGPANSRRRKMP